MLWIGLLIGVVIGVLFTSVYNHYFGNRSINQGPGLTENERRIINLVENSKDIIYYYQTKPEPKYLYVSPSLEDFLGPGLVQKSYEDPYIAYTRIHPDYYDNLHKKNLGEVDFDKPIIQVWKDDKGVYKWFEEYATPIYRNGEWIGFQGIIRNIDEKIKLQQDLEYRSTHDVLTGLYNRTYFEELMDKYDKNVDVSIAIILCDLDDLKYMNDNFGHKQGDTLIKEATKVLNKFSAENVIISRIGGDEFAILLTKINLVDVETLLTNISNEIVEYNEGNTDITIKMSSGYAFNNHSIGKMNELFIEADKNMYADKNARKKVRVQKA